ncbi:DUF4926 domain-containing protein [Pedobacter sp. Bi126]|uniref:DUF4926 domain-containing protein n=1 Tax=unclassified Pedobacter TaxID=2628915 RepID=UPI001DD26A89|nr:hypothetical protein SRABI36_00139 [Pedobacter sp. Bi36]CAH0180027.1 hypothetical protein SRABI126_01235 [Pedobacter sp. Bi126]
MIKEYDIVKSLKSLNDKVFKGCRGTVLIIYSDFPSTFEVEFVDEMNETLDVLTVKANDVIKIE